MKKYNVVFALSYEIIAEETDLRKLTLNNLLDIWDLDITDSREIVMESLK